MAARRRLVPDTCPPDVTITATSPTVTGARTAVSDDQGAYRLLDLPPGEYIVAAERQGFSKVSRTGVVIRAGLNLSLDLTLLVGNLSEAVTVQADTPMLETQRTVQAVNVSGEMQRRLPLTVGGHWSGVTLLTPGVAAQAADAGMGGVYFIAGPNSRRARTCSHGCVSTPSIAMRTAGSCWRNRSCGIPMTSPRATFRFTGRFSE